MVDDNVFLHILSLLSINLAKIWLLLSLGADSENRIMNIVVFAVVVQRSWLVSVTLGYAKAMVSPINTFVILF